MFWKPSPGVVISSGIGGTPVDFVTQFSIEDKRFREFRVVLKAARKHKLRFSTVPIVYSGSATLNQPITFQGQTYNVDLPATALGAARTGLPAGPAGRDRPSERLCAAAAARLR